MVHLPHESFSIKEYSCVFKFVQISLVWALGLIALITDMSINLFHALFVAY